MADQIITINGCQVKLIPYGTCHCGCGGKTNLHIKNSHTMGYVAGTPRKFIHGHRLKGMHGVNWQGGKHKCQGYIKIYYPEHPRVMNQKYVYEHILIVEKALGKYLPKGAEIHHVNEDRSDNRHNNLVVCENNLYHQLLHRRAKALKECGHANWKQCWICKIWAPLEELHSYNKGSYVHRGCWSAYGNAVRQAQKAYGRER